MVLGKDTGHSKTIGNWGCLSVAYCTMANFLELCDDTPDEFNRRMVAAGAFHAQYVQPGALATTFPGEVKYDTFLTRTNSRMVPAIKTSIDAGWPVPARVDFKPQTPDRLEQHWVLLVGYKDNRFIMADPWTGRVRFVDEVYGILGEDVLEGIFYRATDD